MGSNFRLFVWLIVLIIAVLIGIEVVYRNGECCQCTIKVDTICEDGKKCSVYRKANDGCCKCSFMKEHFNIDLYSWRNK